MYLLSGSYLCGYLRVLVHKQMSIYNLWKFVYLHYTTFEASTNVFRAQVCLFLLLVNDDISIYYTCIKSSFTVLGYTSNSFVLLRISSVLILAAQDYVRKGPGLHKSVFTSKLPYMVKYIYFEC